MVENRDEYRPRPTSDGITAEVAIGEDDKNPLRGGRQSYDYWKLFNDGRFYTLLSLFEDNRVPDSVFFEVRITRVTEALLLLARIHRRLGASDTDELTVWFRHQGLSGRTLRPASRDRDLFERTTTEDVVESSLTASLAELESNLVDYVKQVIGPLFVIFEFFELGDSVLEDIVNEFIAKIG